MRLRKAAPGFLLAAWGAALIISGCGGSGRSPVQALRYGAQYYPGEFLLLGAPDLWERYDLHVQHLIFSSGSENNQALIAGRCDVNCGSDSKTVGLYSILGDEIVVIATIQRGDRYATIVKSDSPYRDWHDLRGRVVATRLGSGAEQVLRRYFDQADDLAWNDYDWVNLKLEDMIPRLVAGDIEAFTVWEPTAAMAEDQAVGRVLRSYGDISPVPVCIHTTATYMRAHRSELVKFLAAHLDKAELIRSDPERAAQIAAAAAQKRGQNISAGALERVFRRIDFSLAIDQSVRAAVQETAEYLFEIQKIDKIPRIRFDTTLLEEARALRQRRAE